MIFLLLKTTALLIDFLLLFMPLVVIWLVYSKSVLFLSIIGLAWTIPYNAIMLFSFNGTAGMLIARLRLGHASGFMVPRWLVFVRASVNSIYLIPFIGWVVMFTNAIIVFIYKGWTIGDLMSRTTVYTKVTFDELNNIEGDIHKDLWEDEKLK